jgi:hypothetical protein
MSRSVRGLRLSFCTVTSGTGGPSQATDTGPTRHPVAPALRMRSTKSPTSFSFFSSKSHVASPSFAADALDGSALVLLFLTLDSLLGS